MPLLSRTAPAAGPQLSFDPETAFKVLRSAGYAQHALFVAEQAEQPEWILDVLLEDMGSFPEALAFIGTVTQTVLGVTYETSLLYVLLLEALGSCTGGLQIMDMYVAVCGGGGWDPREDCALCVQA
jgi:hypothetical protein